jgi:hypothetical protein
LSFYVKRTRDGRVAWTGPIRTRRQAEKEAAAWRDEKGFSRGPWQAEVVQSTPEVRRQVRAWQRAPLAPRTTERV